MLHCLRDGFNPKCRNWIEHGEIYIPQNQDTQCSQSDFGDDMVGMLHDVMGIHSGNVSTDDDQLSFHEHLNGVDPETKRFLKLLKDAETDLYPGCKKQTKLSFIARLLQLKVLCRWTNKLFDLLLELLRDSFPKESNLPANFYEANKITTELGFSCLNYFCFCCLLNLFLAKAQGSSIKGMDRENDLQVGRTMVDYLELKKNGWKMNEILSAVEASYAHEGFPNKELSSPKLRGMAKAKQTVHVLSEKQEMKRKASPAHLGKKAGTSSRRIKFT